jgi:hypothetical protein
MRWAETNPRTIGNANARALRECAEAAEYGPEGVRAHARKVTGLPAALFIPLTDQSDERAEAGAHDDKNQQVRHGSIAATDEWRGGRHKLRLI